MCIRDRCQGVRCAIRPRPSAGGQWLESAAEGDAAYAEFQEQQKGMVRVGMLADLVLLNADLFAMPEAEVAQVKPLLTMVDGRAVFREI